MSNKRSIRIYRGGVVPTYGVYSETLPPMRLVDESASVRFDGDDVVVHGNNTVKRYAKRESVVEFRMDGATFYDFVGRVVTERLRNPDTQRTARALVKTLRKLEALETANVAMGNLIGDLNDMFNEEEPRDYVEWSTELRRSGLTKEDRDALESIREFLSFDEDDD